MNERKFVMNETKLVMNETKLVTTPPLRRRDKPQFRGNQGKRMTTTTTSLTNRSMVSLNLPRCPLSSTSPRPFRLTVMTFPRHRATLAALG